MELSDFEVGRPLHDLTTFGIGGPARYFIAIDSIAEMQRVLAFCYSSHLPYFILGKGSNTLFDDLGFNGLVIANRISTINHLQEGLWHVGAGYSFAWLGTQTARKGWSGLEFASGIPGSVGGAVYMNAGAQGRETCESLVSVDFVTHEGHLIQLERKELHFSYRHSPFQTLKGAIVGATFQLTPACTAREEQLKLLSQRHATQPYRDKSAGCIFCNPGAGLTAGALIDQARLKGHQIGGAAVSTVHANFIVNREDAKAADVEALIDHIQRTIHTETGIWLKSEIRRIPHHADEP